MPLLDGSRGIDFTSPHSTGQDPDQLARAMWGEGGARLASAPPQGAARADGCELQLVAYTVRLVLGFGLGLGLARTRTRALTRT